MDELDERYIYDLVEQILNNNPATQDTDHLVRFWVNTPPEMPTVGSPLMPFRLHYLCRYLVVANRDPAARTQLFRLHEHLLKSGEQPPNELRFWVHHFIQHGLVVGRPGPPEESWQHYNVYVAFDLLETLRRCEIRLSGKKLTYKGNLATIGEKAKLQPEGVRSIVRKVKKNSPFFAGNNSGNLTT